MVEGQTTRRPTVYDVAQEANVSIASVSFAFRRPDKLSDATMINQWYVAERGKAAS